MLKKKSRLTSEKFWKKKQFGPKIHLFWRDASQHVNDYFATVGAA